jgi:hypothetical protein
MKFLQLLGKELNEWPPKADWSVCVISTRGKVEASFGRGDKPKPDPIDRKFHTWSICESETDAYWLGEHKALSEKASDQLTAIVTRADWEAERAKLKAPKANGDGWIRHRGGKCPVEAGTLVDVRYRGGQVNEHVKALESCKTGSITSHKASSWSHYGSQNDIMAYRLHKPAEQPAPVSEEAIQVGIDAADAGKLTPIAEVKARILSRKTARAMKDAEEGNLAKFGSIDEVLQAGITWVSRLLEWRDRIYELDTQHAEVESTYQRQISEITQERESLVQKLAGEGLALVEDMSDPKNWKDGDLIECLVNSVGYSAGSLYTIRHLDFSRSVVSTVVDDEGSKSNGWVFRSFKWHSRAAS